MKGMMEAAVLHAPGDIRHETTKIPALAPDDVLIEVKAAGNCGSDLHRIMVEGTYHFPCIPGHEFSGEIVETGENVEGIKAGDRVTAVPLIPCMRCAWCLQGQYNLCEDYDYVGSRSDGAFARYVRIPAMNVVKLPPAVDYEDGSMTDPAAVALHAVLRSGGIRTGETVVILGSGPIGMFAGQWARILGAGRVIGTDIVDDKLAVLGMIGFDAVINAKKEDVVQRILEETGGRGADLLVEVAGSVETHKQSLIAAGKRGRVVHIGRAYRDVLLPDSVYTQIFRKELTVFGSVNSNFSILDHEWEKVVHFMASGQLRAKPLISHRLPLSELPDTFRKMYDKTMVYNKIIFHPEGSE